MKYGKYHHIVVRLFHGGDRMDKASFIKKVRGLDPKSAGHSGGRWELAVHRLVITSDLFRPYLDLRRCFWGHGLRFRLPV